MGVFDITSNFRGRDILVDFYSIKEGEDINAPYFFDSYTVLQTESMYASPFTNEGMKNCIENNPNVQKTIKEKNINYYRVYVDRQCIMHGPISVASWDTFLAGAKK